MNIKNCSTLELNKIPHLEFNNDVKNKIPHLEFNNDVKNKILHIS